MDKKINIELLSSYGILSLVKKIVNDMRSPDNEIIREVRDLLNQVEEATES